MFFLKDYKGEGNDAGSKARNDCESILKNNKFEELDFCLGGRKTYFKGIFKRKKEISKLHEDDILIIQYPYHIKYKNIFYNTLSNLQKNNVRIIAIIHDILSLRGMEKNIQIEKELYLLNSFDVLISHNSYMTKWLRNNNVLTNIVDLEIFDYISNSVSDYKSEDFKNIYFAGNLDKAKSEFIYSKKFEELDINKYLFGINYTNVGDRNQSIIYKGCFKPDELVNHFDNGFGLIWDGKSTEKCEGVVGEYMRYNNPHKASLYLSSGLPVIVWEEAAIAKFIAENKVGITIKSLDEIQIKLNAMTIKDYKQLKNNATKVKENILGGFYLTNAVNKAVTLLKK